ncbi:MAG: EpsG family protein [Lachnospiraceae bacterium]|nr:EpsG family protein [Lachnospiraceae bacterium]
MTLTNYWWLLIWIFVGGGTLAALIPKQRELVQGEIVECWNKYAAVILVLPYIIWAGFRSDVFGDTLSYRQAFQECASSFSEIGTYLSGVTKDKGFYLLMALEKCIFGDSDTIFFLLLAAFQLLVIMWMCRKYSEDYWFSIFLFITSTDYLSWTYNGIRQFTAVIIVYAATPFILKRKYIPSILLVLLASTMHQSALLMLPIIFIIQGRAWNKKTVLCILASLVALLFVDQFTNVMDSILAETQYQNVVSDYQSWNDDGTNPLRVLVYSIPMILSLVGLKFIRAEDDPMINVATGASAIACGIYIISMATSGIFLGRLPIYISLWSQCILLPWEINHMFTERSARLVKMIAVLCYCVFFYYQMHFTWRIL